MCLYPTPPLPWLGHLKTVQRVTMIPVMIARIGFNI